MVNLILDFLKEMFITSFRGWVMLILMGFFIYLVRLWVKERKRLRDLSDARKWRQEKMDRQEHHQ
jgi:hypothetical protein